MKQDFDYPNIAQDLLHPPKACESCRMVFPQTKGKKWMCTFHSDFVPLDDYCNNYRFDLEYYTHMLEYKYGKYIDDLENS